MVRDRASRAGYRRTGVETVAEQLQAGYDVVFLTEGGPLLHRTLGGAPIHYL